MSEKAKVYYTTFRTTPWESMLIKLQRLMKAAGLDTLPLEGKFCALKIHFGEPGCLSFLRPNYARTVVDYLKERGARPFLTDCNTLYVGSRRNALDHLDAAELNGFTPVQTGCHAIIADGLMGTDDVSVPIDGEYCKEALIGRAIMDADVVISLTHFKGHESTGIGGTLKNLGMGCGSTAGKRHMHRDGKPSVNKEDCVGCGRCTRECAHGAISFQPRENGKGRYAVIDHSKCVGCGRCVGACFQQGAVTGPESADDVLNCKIAEYAWAVVKDRPCFHISFVMDVSPNCDCHSENDAPIVPDIGIFASMDPVALDTACAEACNRAERLPGTWVTDTGNHTDDIFHDAHTNTNWRVVVEHGQKLGMGTMDYELIEVK